MGDRVFKTALTLLFVAMSVVLLLLMSQNRDLKTRVAAGAQRNLELQAALSAAGQTPLQALHAGDRVHPLELQNLAGLPTRIGYDETGQDTVLLVFSPQCPACQANVTYWNALQEAHADAPASFYAISAASLESTQRFVEEFAVEGPVLVSDVDTLRGYNLTHIPTTIVVGPEGVVRRVWVGVLPDEALETGALSG